MQKTAVSISIKASDRGRSCLLLVYSGLMLGCLLHPQLLIRLLVLPLALHGWWHWRYAFGAQAPVTLELETDEVWLTTRQGSSIKLSPPLLWRSRWWLVFRRPGFLVPPWLLWPDAVSAEEHHQLRTGLSSWR
ncbi:MAG: hypothetical protein IBX50_05740 [Marinospirillum sp.]|nr:hypothetical protein [Marinospirillum sp.]